jgi:hypothetical protein
MVYELSNLEHSIPRTTFKTIPPWITIQINEWRSPGSILGVKRNGYLSDRSIFLPSFHLGSFYSPHLTSSYGLDEVSIQVPWEDTFASGCPNVSQLSLNTYLVSFYFFYFFCNMGLIGKEVFSVCGWYKRKPFSSFYSPWFKIPFNLPNLKSCSRNLLYLNFFINSLYRGMLPVDIFMFGIKN